MTQTLSEETPVVDTTGPQTDGEERDRHSHYVPKDQLADAIINGTAVKALCGKMWIPGRDPEKYPVCPTCREIHEGIPASGPDDA